MPERKSRSSKEQESAIILRRSPRFLHVNQSNAESRTENPKQKKFVADSFSTPLGSSITKTQKKIEVISQKGGRKSVHSIGSVKSSKGSRRSRKLEGGEGKIENNRDLQKEYVIEKRVTRSSVRGSKNVKLQVDGCVTEEGSGERRKDVSNEGKVKAGLDPSKKIIGRTEKMATRSLSRKKIKQGAKGSSASLDEKSEGNVELSEPHMSRRCEKECGIQSEIGDGNSRRKMQIGEKRKRNEVEEECEVLQGWTKEQELALRRAYFTAKPTPHFWKKVSRMVPGKSAEECFNRIHADHMTPTQPRTRSKIKPSPLSFSASKLLSPAETKVKKLRFTKRKSLLAQKTIRQLLQKQQNEEYETDLFAILEQTTDRSPINFQAGKTFSSPPPNQGSVHKKSVSRLSSSEKAAFVSPPVLKQVKNKALHEKYIDQLHCRDAKRRAQSLKTARRKNDNKLSDVKLKSVKLAKEALIFEAQDAIHQFRTLQSRVIEDDGSSLCDEDDGEDGTP